MNNARRKEIEKITADLEAIKERIEALQEEEQDAFDNLPESIHMTREEHSALLNFTLAALGYIPPKTDEEKQAFDELHKDYTPRIKDMHVDVDKIIKGEIKCE